LFNDIDDPVYSEEAVLVVTPAALLGSQQQLMEQTETTDRQFLHQTLTTTSAQFKTD